MGEKLVRMFRSSCTLKVCLPLVAFILFFCIVIDSSSSWTQYTENLYKKENRVTNTKDLAIGFRTTTEADFLRAENGHCQPFRTSPTQVYYREDHDLQVGNLTNVSSRKLHIVLSASFEPYSVVSKTIKNLLTIPSISRADPLVVVISKQHTARDVFSNLAEVRIVIEQPNVGREGLAYLAYIIALYEDLPAHVLFLQAQPDLYSKFVKPRLMHLQEHTGFMHLAKTAQCSCDSCLTMTGLVRLREIWMLFRRTFCPSRFWVSGMGQFAVSSRRIRDNPLSAYKTMLDYLLAPPSHFVQADLRYLGFTKKKYERRINFTAQVELCDQPLALHVLERSWSSIFNCYGRFSDEDTGDGSVSCKAESGMNCFDETMQCLDRYPPSEASEVVSSDPGLTPKIVDAPSAATSRKLPAPSAGEALSSHDTSGAAIDSSRVYEKPTSVEEATRSASTATRQKASRRLHSLDAGR